MDSKQTPKPSVSLKPGTIIELTIETLAFGGEGVGKIQNGEKLFTVFVEEAVPGDFIKARIFKKKKNFAKAYLQEIIKPSDLRIKPRCQHFGSPFLSTKSFNCEKGCGGCTWQFLEYEKQLEFKERQVKEAIKHLGGIQKDVVLPILGMEKTSEIGQSKTSESNAQKFSFEPWFYRNKMEFSFSRTKDQKISLGLHIKRRHYDVIELTECFLLTLFIGELVEKTRKFFQKLDEENKIDPNLKLQSFTVRQGKNTGEIMIILSAENGDATFLPTFKDFLLDFFSFKKINLDSIFFLHIHNQKGKPKTISEKLLYGKPTIREELRLQNRQTLTFDISPQAFFQPNTFQAQTLYQKALEAAGLSGTEIVYDLFCGTGTIGIFCAEKARKVYGIELNPSAIENAKENAKLNHIKNIEFLVGDVDKHLPDLPEKPDVIIVDPPRSGLTPKIIEKIINFYPKKIVYVSCNPSTLARDIKIMTQSNYDLKHVQPVDMFPQTYHIENVALLGKL